MKVTAAQSLSEAQASAPRGWGPDSRLQQAPAWQLPLSPVRVPAWCAEPGTWGSQSLADQALLRSGSQR